MSTASIPFDSRKLSITSARQRPSTSSNRAYFISSMCSYLFIEFAHARGHIPQDSDGNLRAIEQDIVECIALNGQNAHFAQRSQRSRARRRFEDRHLPDKVPAFSHC